MAEKDPGFVGQWRARHGGGDEKCFPWADGTDFSDLLERNGFADEPAFSLGYGHGYGFRASVYPPRDPVPGQTRYLVVVEIGDALELVECEGLSSLLQCLHGIEPVAAAALAASDRDEEERHVLKHRDAPSDVCRFCARRKNWYLW